MTVIAYRDGIMASDSGSWAGSASHGWTRNVVRSPDGTLYGCAGNAAEIGDFLAWAYLGGEGIPKPRPTNDDQSSVLVLVVERGGIISMITAYGRERYPGAPYMAIGVESDVALGALWMGATAEQAVMAACEHGDRARLPVQFVRHAE